jgi:hypothetical protein
MFGGLKWVAPSAAWRAPSAWGRSSATDTSLSSLFEPSVTAQQEARVLESLCALESFEERKARIMEVVKVNGRALQHASRDMRRDPDVVRLAVMNSPSVCWCVDAQLCNDRAFVLNLVNTVPCGRYMLEYVPPAFRRDVNIMFAASSRDGLSLMWASEELQDMEHIALAAVQSNGLALKYVSPRLGAMLYIVMRAVGNNGHALRFAPTELRDNLRVVDIAVWTNPSAIEHASKRIKDNWYASGGRLRRKSAYDRITTRR